MISDFFIGEADPWREEAWRMIRERTDLHFFIVTKRIDRFTVGLPGDPHRLAGPGTPPCGAVPSRFRTGTERTQS